MCGLFTYYTRPVKDKEALKEDMAKGRWSDYDGVSVFGGGEAADLKGIEEVDESTSPSRSLSRHMESGDAGASSPKTQLSVDDMALLTTQVDGGDQAHERSAYPGSPFYEVVLHADEARTMVVRKQPGVESMWHASKHAVSPSTQLLEVFRRQDRSPYTVGSFTPARSLNTRAKEQEPLRAWVSETWLGQALKKDGEGRGAEGAA